MMRIILLLVGVMASCAATHESNHDIPFDLDNFSSAQRAVLRAGSQADTSSYLILSRPVVFQVVLAGNDVDEVRNGGPIDRPVDVLIFALGETDDDRLVDYGWIEEAQSGRRVWEMTMENSVHAGGDERNRKSLERLTLQPGSYRLRYTTNATHAYPDWEGVGPEREHFYGVTVFNLTALPLIEQRLREAGVPQLGSSLTE